MSKKCKEKKKNCVSIGGQAVIEGVMMRGESSMATAVRDADGIIRLETKRIKPAKKRNIFFRLPIIRGVVSFITSMFGGMKVLMRSADVFGEGEPSRFEKWLAEKLKVNIMSIVSTLSLLIGLVLAVGLFILLPQYAREGLERLVTLITGNPYAFGVWAKNFIEGGMKLLIFVLYILLCSLLKDIKRTFMYHGAEHKTISCHESGLPLTVDNVKKCSRVHDRCGTTFMVFVMVISILMFAVVESLLVQYTNFHDNKLYRTLLKLACLPVVAGFSYELLKLLAKTKSWLVFPLKLPGLLLQRITTREPDDKMIEVAITSFNAVLEMDKDPTILEQEFIIPQKRKELVEDVKQKLKENGILEEAEAEWIVSITIGVKRNELDSEKLVMPKYIEIINKIVDQRITGRPLWYCIGDTEFYGYKIKVDERVLIPRPETEILASKVIDVVKSKGENVRVLDLCTGSGAIAITVKKESNATVFASDISQNALDLAMINAKDNDADITFINSDMFNSVNEKFDIIVSNPPYIKKSDLTGLQKEVKDFEPISALDGGEDGLDFYRIIANQCKNYLNNDGVLLLECGINQAQDIKNMLVDFRSVEIIKDYENIDRIVKAVL